MGRKRSRRNFLATLGLGTAGLVVGCGSDTPAAIPFVANESGADEPPTATSTATSSPTPTATPTPRPAGHEIRSLFSESPWQTDVSIRSTGIDGPALVVLGGVHGNEPGGWLAADQVVDWEPARGVLAVLPRANVLAIAPFLREAPGEGDLNRQYPGDPESELPSSRIAAAITALARELNAEVLMDLHESWAFYVRREAAVFQNRQQAGTAFLGQTITGGEGPRGATIAGEIAAIVNASITLERDMFIPRDGWAFRRNDAVAPTTNRGRSSLSLGGHVPGLTPVLVETGQEDQSIEQRTAFQLAAVRATMDILEM